MPIEVYKNTKIYIAAPAAIATGGPELLHQLGYYLRYYLGIETYMYYYPSNHPHPVHPNYKEYEVPFVREIKDGRSNVLIVPEGVESIRLLRWFFKIRKIIWLLSVDNLFLSQIFQSKLNFLFPRLINKIWRIFKKENLIDINELVAKDKRAKKFTPLKLLNQGEFYFAQSYYALNFLKKNGVPQEKIFYLSDHLHKSFLETAIDLSKKENICAYNPQKGLAFTKKIIKLATKNIKFVPLINMTREEVINTLKKTKVYIDFGNHPGKDRIPREAAILGCCVITSKRGSAAFFEDVPIPEEYKFEDREENIPKIIEKIKDCFENFEKRFKDFDYYREVIRNEPQKFLDDLKKIFVKVE